MKRQELKLVNSDGVVVDKIGADDTFTIKRKGTEDYLERTVEVNKGEAYVKVFISNWADVTKRLDGTTSQLLLMMLPYTGYENGVLQYPSGRKVTRNSIINETGFSKNTVDKCINALMHEQIIGRHRTGRENCYTVNPYIFLKGRRINKTLKVFYEKSRWAKV